MAVKLIFGVILWLCSLCLTAQSFRATVVDENKRPLEMVSVVLLDSTETPVSFTKTDETGNFLLVIDEGKRGIKLSFSFVGYETKVISLNDFTNDVMIKMKESELLLNEVKVISKRIEQQGDTLTYSVVGFKQAQDRSIADVIAKMPGLTVKNNGQIEYQGKPINKFYIEGADLLGGKYSQASENLSAEKVKAVQIYENHQPVKMLKNVKFSDRAALNIVLNDESKNVWTGVADLGVGTTLQNEVGLNRDSRFIAMLFSKQFQNISMYKTNNVGNEITEEVTDLIGNAHNSYEYSSPIDNIELSNIEIDDERVNHNSSHLVATNCLYKPNEDVDYRCQISGFLDKNTENNSSTTVYSDILDGISVVEQMDILRKKNKIQCDFLYKKNSRYCYIDNNFSGMLDFVHDQACTNLNGMNVNQNIEIKKRFFSDIFNLSRLYGKDKIWSLNSVISHNFIPGLLLQRDGITEKINLSVYNLNVESGFSHKISSFHIYYRCGVNSSIDDLTVSSKEIELQNTNSYKEFNPYITPSIFYHKSPFRITAAFRISWLNQSFEKEKLSTVVAEPSVMLRYEPWPNLEITSNYSFSHNNNGLLSMSSIPIYTNYICRFIGTGMLENVKNHNAGVVFSYKNIEYGLFANLSATTKISEDNVIYQSEMDKDLYIRRATEKRADVKKYMLSSRISKSLGWSKTLLAINGNYSCTNYNVLISNVLCDCQMQNFSTGISIDTSPFPFLSLEYTSKLYGNRMENKSVSDLSTGREYRFSHVVSSFLLFGKWQVEWKNEYYESTYKGSNKNFFSDVSFSYKTKKNEWILTLNNIFGNGMYSHYYIDNNFQEYSTITLRQREVMLKYSYNF